MIETKGLTYAYPNSAQILHEICFSAERGHFLALLGNNGAGKSTLLKCLNGILPVGARVVFADGADLHGMKRRHIAQTMAYVEQSNEASRLTVYDVVLMGRRPYITVGPTEQDLAIVEQTLDRLQLRGLSMRYIDELSGGELRRMAIVRALTHGPDFILADEPTGDLDDENTHLVLSALRNYAHEQKKAVFIVTHESDAMEYADRSFRMDGGQMTDAGDGWQRSKSI